MSVVKTFDSQSNGLLFMYYLSRDVIMFFHLMEKVKKLVLLHIIVFNNEAN